MKTFDKPSIAVLIIIAAITSISCRQAESFSNTQLSRQDYAYDFAHLPDSCVISSKTISFDSTTSKNLRTCDEIPAEINTVNSCILTKGTKRFVKVFTAFFDKSQALKEIVRYSPMGGQLFSIQDLIRDTIYFNTFNISKFGGFKIDKNRFSVIDGCDTLPIADVWTKEKLIFVSLDKIKKASIEKGRTIIYGYN